MKLIIASMTEVVCVPSLRQRKASHQKTALLHACHPTGPRSSHQRMPGKGAETGFTGATLIIFTQCCCFRKVSSMISFYPEASLWDKL